MNDIKKLPNTIDLAWMMFDEKTTELEEMWIIEKEHSKKWAIIVAVVTLILISMFISKTYANDVTDDIYTEHARFINRFPLEKTLIGCYNDRSKRVRSLYNPDTWHEWICLELWDHNIKLPPRSQIVTWLKYFSEHQILNRLALVNFESDFNIHASNKYAKGYVQTLRSYNIPIDMDSQLTWLKNTQAQHNNYTVRITWTRTMPTCKKYWNTYNPREQIEQWEYAVLGCMYRRHYNRNTGIWYGKRWVKVTKFYKRFLFWIID